MRSMWHGISIVILLLFACGIAGRAIAQAPSRPVTWNKGQAHWWEDPITSAHQPARKVLPSSVDDTCIVLPFFQPAMEWWGATWSAEIDGNLEIVYSNWCGANVRITNNPAAEVDPHLNYVGEKIAFASNREGNFDIYAVAVDGSNLQRLTTSPLNERNPDWSKDNYIVFSSGSDVQDSEIWVMNENGQQFVQLTDNNSYDVYPTWTPDGTQIVWVQISADGRNGTLWRMNRDGTNQVQLMSPLPGLSHPTVAPKGNDIYFDADTTGDGVNDLAFLNQDANVVTVLRSNFDPNLPPSVVHEYVAGSWLFDMSGFMYEDHVYSLANDHYVLGQSLLGIYCSYGCVDRNFTASGFNFAPDIVNRDPLPPVTKLHALPKYSYTGDISLAWNGYDQGLSGLDAIQLQFRRDRSMGWSNVFNLPEWIDDKSGKITFGTYDTGPLYFRLHGRDKAGNEELFGDDTVEEVSTYVANSILTGRLVDGRGLPLGLQSVVVEPSGVEPIDTDLNGEFGVPVLDFGPYLINGVIDIRQPQQHLDYYLPTKDSVIRNGGFEEDFSKDWQSLAASILDNSENVIGKQSALLSPLCSSDACDEVTKSAYVSQQVMIPLTMTKPTLTFMYRILDNDSPDSTFSVEVSSVISVPNSVSIHVNSIDVGSTITTASLFTQTDTTTDWVTKWLDLSSWQGKEITVTFALYQNEPSHHKRVFLEAISLGSWLTPWPKEVSPTHLEDSDMLTLTIRGENFMGKSHVKIGGVEMQQVVQSGETELEVQVPADFEPGIYTVQVMNPQGQSAYAPVMISIGKQVFLPMIER